MEQQASVDDGKPSNKAILSISSPSEPSSSSALASSSSAHYQTHQQQSESSLRHDFVPSTTTTAQIQHHTTETFPMGSEFENNSDISAGYLSMMSYNDSTSTSTHHQSQIQSISNYYNEPSNNPCSSSTISEYQDRTLPISENVDQLQLHVNENAPPLTLTTTGTAPSFVSAAETSTLSEITQMDVSVSAVDDKQVSTTTYTSTNNTESVNVENIAQSDEQAKASSDTDASILHQNNAASWNQQDPNIHHQDYSYISGVQSGTDDCNVESMSTPQPTAPQPFIGPQIPDFGVASDKPMEYVPQEPVDSKFILSSSCPLYCVEKATSVFMNKDKENFLRGCKWSPDGTHVVTSSNDNVLRIFNPTTQHQGSVAGTSDVTVNELTPRCVVKESGLVYDYCWFPGKTDYKPETCRVACCCPGSPIHLWNSQDGQIVSSYRAFDHCDEITSAYSVSFSPDGSKLYGGYKNSIRIFDTEYSHRQCTMITTLNPKTKEGHKGIISCICHGAPGSNTFVTGSYSRHVGIYYSLTNELVCLIQGQQGGVTHMMFSPDGNRLYTGGRKDPEIVCWDMRNTGQILCTFLRDVQTNQRVYFDLSQSGRYLVSGNHDGSVQIWDTQGAGHEVAGEIIMKPCYAFNAHKDCTNGVSFNPHSATLATASGQRHFKDFHTESDSDEDDDDSNSIADGKEFSLKIWNIPCMS